MADRTLPEVLAGPIVRRVEPRSCSVWIALRDPAPSVKLTVWRGAQVAGAAAGQVASGNAAIGSVEVATRQFGRKLHIALATLSLASPLPVLEPGTVYAYDLQIGGRGLKQLGFLVDGPVGQGLALGYATDRLPTFVTPPLRVEDTCFAHTSCRRANVPDHDALAGVDELIRTSLNTLAERPQQLFLTGDQIYADDLPAKLLEMLSGIAEAVIGPDELLGGHELNLFNFPPEDLTHPDPDNLPKLLLVQDGRKRTVQRLAGFTTTDDCHLLGFGEYIAMYLAVWNPRIWAVPESGLFSPQTAMFRADVPAVARALANVATYMIFDDHDVTDDWNLSQKWMNRVYSKPVGAQIVRNALCAYAVCQGWGNDPAAFVTGRNAELLALIESRFGQPTGPYPKGADGPMNQLLGLITATPEQQVRWNYQVPSPMSMMVVLDTRTRRKFAGQGYQPPDLLGQNRDAQLPAGPLTDGRQMMFVVSAAPVFGPDVIDAIGWPAAQTAIDAVHLGKGLDEASTNFGEIGEPYRPDPPPNIGTEKYDAEGWGANEEARETFLKRLATYPAVAVLGGDVHFSYTTVMDHYRKGVAQPSRLVQLTCSPAHNRFKPVVKVLVRQNPVLQLVAGAISIARLGWNGKSSVVVPPPPAVLSPGRRGRLVRSPSLIPAAGWPAGTTFPADKGPDWSWRLTVLRDSRAESDLPSNLRQQLFSATQELKPADAFKGYQAIAARHQAAASTGFTHLRQLVFNSSIGVVRVRRDAQGQLFLRHSLHSSDGPGAPRLAEGTRHETPLTPSTEPAPTLTTR